MKILISALKLRKNNVIRDIDRKKGGYFEKKNNFQVV